MAMAKEKQKAVAFTSAARRQEQELEEEEEEAVEAELEGSCSESSLGAALGAGRLSPADPGGPEELHGPHVATCTFTISLAVPVATSQRHKPSISFEMQRRRSDIGKDASIPKIRRYYHMEYFLLPDDIEPRKLDLVLFGTVAKFFLESESKVVKPWFENDQIWVSWNHRIDINVTNKFLTKLREHKITLKLWDTRDKVCAKAKFSKPRLSYLQAEDVDAIGGVKFTVLCQRKLFEDNQSAPSCTKTKSVKKSSVLDEVATSPVAGLLTDEVELYERESGLQNLPYRSRTSVSPSVSHFSVPGSISFARDKALCEGHLLKQKSIAGYLNFFGSKTEKKKLSFAKPDRVDPLDVRISRSSTPRRPYGSNKEKNQSHPKMSNAETLVAALAKKNGIASLQLDLMPLLSGEKSVTSHLKEKSPKVLDAYLTFTVETPLMSERQRCELNPLIIRILSATYLPTTPVPIERLQESCVPTYCRYRFHDLPPHQTQGQMHGTHVYFKDVNVVLTGTIKPAKLYEYLRGPPMEIEVHDRDQKTVEDPKKPSLFGEEQDDARLSNIGFLTYKHSVQNPFTDKNKSWDSYGVAKVSLNGLLLGEKYLNISVPIHSCSVPDPTIYQKDNKNEKMARVSQPVNGLQASPLPVGHYLESDSLLKVRVEIAVPLGPQAGTVDSKVADCPYGCIIYIFDYKNASFLQDLLQEITGINAKALQLDCFPLQIAQKALATFRLKTKLKEISELDIITGFHILDGKIHLLVLEGLKDKAIKRLWDQQLNRPHNTEDGRLEVLYNSQLSFHQRLYTDLEAILYHIHLCKPLSSITKQPLLYIREMVPQACFQALSRLDYICHCKKLRDVIHGNLLPSAEMITVLSQEFGIPLTNEDLFVQKPSLLSLPSFGFSKQTEIVRKKRAIHSLLDNYNKKYMLWKKEMEDKMKYDKDHIQTNIDAVYLLNKKVKRPILKTARSFPDDGKSVYNYSSQRLNSAEFAKKLLRQEMAKKPERRFAYCHEYLSAMFDPVDLDTVWKESVEESKNRSLSPNGFIIPGFKSTIESNLHSQSLDEENKLFANFLEPVVNRDTWSWDKRHLDFDLYKKPPDYFTVSAPAGSQTDSVTPAFDDTKLKVYRCSTAAELTAHGPKASSQLNKLQGLLKDVPAKYSLKRPGLILEPIPALSVLQNAPRDISSASPVNRTRSAISGFVPGIEERHSLKWNGNMIPCYNMEHKKFEKLKGADFKLHCYAHSFLYKRLVKEGRDRTNLVLHQDTSTDEATAPVTTQDSATASYKLNDLCLKTN
ncbi:uncharacterized protein KIAA1257 homolog isoform X2 [Alligator sinensis]|uniref:Uncharacterized protein KIAA1257 homolog isoform X2 n=1 Tax=Alligator sinensis TaxID=38654 RepID=A0A1U7RQ31_ALLSI|nr:uncharacterized protein KIAA1257 homolog isoform X2 [Alligator sinensis]